MLKKFHLSKMGKHWLFSLLAGFLLIFASLLLVSMRAVSLMQTDKIQETEKITNTVQRSMDHYLSALQNSASELMLNNQNLALQSADSREEFTSASTYRFSELMYNIKVANALVGDIYLYYPSYDYVVGTEGSYLAKGYYLLSNQLMTEGYEEWKENVLESEQTGFSFYTPESDREQRLYFRRQMPVGGDSDPTAVLIISVDGEEFSRLLDMALPHDGSTSIAVFGKNNELYQTGTDSAMLSEKAIQSFLDKSGDNVREIRSSAYIGWRVPSEYQVFYYMVASDKKVLLAHIILIQHLLIAGIIGCTVAGVMLSLFLSIRHHRPIEKVINKLEDTRGGAPMDYQEFEEKINELILDNENVSRLNERMLWTAKENILTDILNQRLMESASVQSLFQTSGVTLDYVYYCMMLADVSGRRDRQEMRKSLFELGKCLEQELNSVDAIPALIGDTAVFLLNYDEFDFEPVERLRAMFREAYGEESVFQCSEVFMSPEQVVSIYEQLRFQLQKQLGGVENSLENAEEVRDKEGKILLERWKKALVLREYQNAGDMVRELFDKYVASVPDSYVCMNRQYALIHETFQCVENEDARYQAGIYVKYLPVIKKCAGMQETAECLREILTELEQLNSRYTANQKDKLAYKIKKIIDSNYGQHYLGLYYISEQVNVSTSYVSKVFKEEYGIGVVEYMNRMRIDSAKRIMETEKLTVKEIAERVGFTSDIHFIRIFKKYENTTPGVYKKQSK